MVRYFLLAFMAVGTTAFTAPAEPPVASYIFPAGGQRGTTVKVKVGGLNLHQRCGFEVLSSGLKANPQLASIPTLWFEGPILPLPESQRQEDYPKDMAGSIAIAPDAEPGLRSWRVFTSQGAAPARRFIVGDLPEVVEEEMDGSPIPVNVKLPVTVNGRIFPRADVDAWTVAVKKGQTVTCLAAGPSLGSPLEPLLRVHDPAGRLLLESTLLPAGDARAVFTAPADGVYQVRILDLNHQGSQAHVYRLTMTTGAWVDSVFPLGGRRGQSQQIQVQGQNVPAQTKVTLPAQGEVAGLRLQHQGQPSNPFLFDLDDLPEVTHDSGKPTILPWPAIGNGRVEKPGEVHAWAIQGKKGETVQVELRAATLGSSLDGLLTLSDDKGKEVLEAETKAPAVDPAFTYTFPQDGYFLITVRDRFPTRGGAEFGYRLRVIRPATTPDFRLTFKIDALALERGKTVKLQVNAERLGGLNDPIELQAAGLPEGVTVTGTTIGPKQASVEMMFKADAKAKIQAVPVTLQGMAKLKEQTLTRQAALSIGLGQPQLTSVLIGVALPTPFKIKGEYDMRWASRGSTHQRRYQIERQGYDGPIEVRLADKQARHLQGVTGPVLTIPAGAKEFNYPVFLPPWMETGRTSRTCVMGIAVIKDHDGSEHQVSFSSVGQNEQVVAVVEPGRLSLSLEQPSVLAEAGKTVEVAFELTRGNNLAGEAKVELIQPGGMSGLTATPVVVVKDQSKGRLKLLWSDKLPTAFSSPLLVRVTIMEEGRPVVAEARLDAVRGEK